MGGRSVSLNFLILLPPVSAPFSATLHAWHRIDFRSIFPRKQSAPLTAGPDLKLKKKKGKVGVRSWQSVVVCFVLV